MALMETLIDTFNTNLLSSQWTLSGAGTPSNQIKNTNRELQITSDAVNGDYFYCLSTSTYDLTGSYAYVRVVSAGSQVANFDYLPLLLQVDGNNQLWWDINGGTLGAFKKITSSQTSILTTAYIAATHRWLRIRESGGTTFWDYSSNGGDWINFTSQANPITVTALNAGMGTGQFGAAASTVSATDSFNTFPSQPGNIFRYIAVGNGMSRSEGAT